MTFSYVDNDIQGFTTAYELQWLNQQAQTVNSIVEIGSFKGRSTHALLSGCAGTVWAVDPFGLGSDTGVRRSEKSEGIYEQFKRNVGHFGNLEVLRMKSDEAAKKFKPKSIDMVFIDGDHRYSSVKQDIELWMPVCKVLICGHDYHLKPVMKAVREVVPKAVVVSDRIWEFRKGEEQ